MVAYVPLDEWGKEEECRALQAYVQYCTLWQFVQSKSQEKADNYFVFGLGQER